MPQLKFGLCWLATSPEQIPQYLMMCPEISTIESIVRLGIHLLSNWGGAGAEPFMRALLAVIERRYQPLYSGLEFGRLYQ